MLRKTRNKTSVAITLTTYVMAFVLPNLTNHLVVAAQQPSPVDATDLAWTLGIAPAKSAPVGESLKSAPPVASAAGEPSVLDSRSALSAAVLTTIGGRGTQFSEVSLFADWDGKEDLTSDRGVKVADLSAPAELADATLTRSAISAHTYANGFNENV